jgi:hypothetical protein
MSAAATTLAALRETPAASHAVAAAAGWCAAARELPGAPPLLAYGTRESSLVLAGERRRLVVRRYDARPLALDALWAQLDAFCRPRTFVAGYVGFDAVWPDGTKRPAATAVPTVELWEPGAVLRLGAGGLRPAVLRDWAGLRGLRPVPPRTTERVALGPYDSGARAFGESVALTLAGIRAGLNRRLTLARRVALPPDLDLLASFATPPAVDDADCGRSFYARTRALELAGHSPELLAQGDAARFTCHKLSGTGTRSADRAEDERMRAALLGDAKVLDEHALTIEATRATLAALGEVRVGAMRVCERPGLRHLLTPLDVIVRPGTPWSAIVRAILPAGAQPRSAGLRSLDGLERGGRGAYYGVIGLRYPDGRFEFSQVLRSLFRDASGVHTFVGAAVTRGSTVEGETAETRLKLDDIVARRAASAPLA